MSADLPLDAIFHHRPEKPGPEVGTRREGQINTHLITLRFKESIMKCKVSGLLDRTLDLGLIVILEFVLIAHHQVRMRHAELRRANEEESVDGVWVIYSHH